MANAYLAHDLRHDRELAVKVLRADLAAILGTERFLREIKIAANLTHPHLVPLHDSGEAEGFLYYVMPYIEGETLRQRIEKEGELPYRPLASTGPGWFAMIGLAECGIYERLECGQWERPR